MERFVLHNWDERIGPDASVVKVGGGKKQLEKGMKQRSDVPLPLKDKFLVQLPVRNYAHTVIDTDHQLWKAYRCTVNADDNRLEGKKMCHSSIEPSYHRQAKIRKNLRDKLREAEELALQNQQIQFVERQQQQERHKKRGEAEDSSMRLRAKEMGFEGLRKAVLKPPLPSPEVPQSMVEEAVKSAQPGMAYRTSGKKMFTDHSSRVDNGGLFGGSTATEPMKRWNDKSFA